MSDRVIDRKPATRRIYRTCNINKKEVFFFFFFKARVHCIMGDAVEVPCHHIRAPVPEKQELSSASLFAQHRPPNPTFNSSLQMSANSCSIPVAC